MKRYVAAGLTLLLGIVAVYGYLASRRERIYSELIASGEAALAADESFAAIEAFSGASALKPESMLPYLKRGETYRHRGELESARRDLRKAAGLDPLAPRPLELLGDVNFDLGVRALQAASSRPDGQTDPASASALFARAAEQYEAAVRLDDRSPRVLYKLALARYRDGRAAPAVSALQRAIAVNDQFAEAYYLLGLCLRDLQKLDEAERALKRSVALAPAMLHAREELGDLSRRMGRRDAWIVQLEALLELDPGPSREVALGLAYAEAGQSSRAVLALGRAAARYPGHVYTYVALGRVWLDVAQSAHDRVALRKALGALEGAVAQDDSSEALTLFGRALLLADDEELAERMLRRATEKVPADPKAFYYLADAAERRGHPDIARQALLDYRALEGEEDDARRRSAFAVRVANLSMRVSDAPSAVTWYKRAVSDGGPDAALLVRLADAQLRAGDAPGARVTLTKALERDPANAAARALQTRLR